jgi:LCP family protein required for cell wall assembly
MRSLAVGLVLVVLAGATWMVVAVHLVAPRAGLGDFAALIRSDAGDNNWVARKVDSNERINLLLLARGGAGHDSPDFTDTMLVLSIRPRTHRATVISLPRWLWVEIPAPENGVVQGKLYTAYALAAGQEATFLRAQWRTPTGQGDLAAATVSATIGQPIDAWIAIDLKGFEALIDALGGVTVTIPETLDDPTYPTGDDRTIHIHFDAGTQTLDGKQALQYARSRLSTSEGDRARRQEIVLSAMFSALRKASLSPAAIAAMGPLKDGLRTDLLPVDASLLRNVIAGLKQQDVKRITLEDSALLKTIELEQQPVRVPASGSWSDLQAYVAGELP